MDKKLYQDCQNGKNDRLYHTTDLEKIFPELAESEDEVIRNWYNGENHCIPN